MQSATQGPSRENTSNIKKEPPPMAGQDHDSAVVYSSIALLQERFRQLERAKVMRQQREVLKLFPEAEPIQCVTSAKPPGLFYESEMILQQRRSLKETTCTRTNTHSNYKNNQVRSTPKLMTLWSDDDITLLQSDNFDESDVDTSLHL